MSIRPNPAPPVREMNLYRQYFDLINTGRKTIEVRVLYPRLSTLEPGHYIRFTCGPDSCLTRVTRVSLYISFEEMIYAEGPSNINPDAPRHQQLTEIRRIYSSEKEALGVLAIQIERTDVSPP